MAEWVMFDAAFSDIGDLPSAIFLLVGRKIRKKNDRRLNTRRL